MENEEEDKNVGNKACDDTGPDAELFDSWVRKHYGESSRTKTITNDKYSKICHLIRGEDSNTNAKFRFWVRSKGFRLISHDKTTDVVTDDPKGSLFVSLHAKEDTTPIGERSIEKFLRTNLPAISFFRKVAMVEEFYDIIKCAHVDDKGVHAGQKKTYRVVSDTYAFLPREVITFYLLNCNTCKPRIQKYGPIHSKIKINNTLPPKISSEKNGAFSPKPQETAVHEKDKMNNNSQQVIRPSPKRLVPTYMELALSPEVYSKMYDYHMNQRSTNNVSSSQSQDKSKYLNNENSTYPLELESKPDQELLHRYNKEYQNHAENMTPNTISSQSEATSTSKLFSIRTTEFGNGKSKEEKSYNEIEKRLLKIEDRDPERPFFQDKTLSPSYSEFSTCTGSCCSHLTATLDYFQRKKEKLERYHGYRMEPYKLFQRNDTIRNYQERIFETQNYKDTLFHSKSSVPYFAENKDKYIDLYRDHKGWSNDDFPTTSSIWHRKLMSGNITETGWKSLSRQAEMQMKASYKSNYQ